jgi:tetratricopeptide (TPR) repeat protein
MFVLAHEHAHIILARAGSPSEGALQEEIDADNYALRICLSYANTPGRGPSEPAIAVAAAQVFLQLIELRRMASKEPHRDSHPSTAERQAALFLTVATSHAALYQAAVDVSRALHGIVAKLWNLSYPAIARGIATAPPIARFSDETLRYIWFVAGTARGKALGSGAAEEARQPGDPRLRLASEVGIVAKTGQLVDAANLTLDERRAYDRAFEVTRDPVHLSMFDAGRKAALQKAASNLVSPEKARERAEAGTDNEESRARMTESWIKGAEAYERRDFLEAASHLESARDVGAKLASPAECIEITTLFARSLHEVGQLARALPLFQQLVDYNKNFYGPRHWRTAEAQNNLGLLLKDSGNALDAESMLREALHLMEDHFGPLHSKVGTVVGNLALALHAGGHSADSIPFFTRAIDIHVECHGAKSLEVGRDQSNLAQALLDQQRWTEAEGMLREALAATESVLGPDDPLVARRLNNLSRALLGGGKFEEASQEIQRALSIHERRFGRKNFERAAMLSNLGSVFVATGQLSEAEEAMREALSIDVDVLDPQHPALARELCNLAFVLVQQNSREAGPLIEAESLARESLRIAEAGFGAESRNLVPILNTLALILIRRGQDEAASALERRVAQLTEG